MLEQRPLMRRKHGHLLNEFWCAHRVNLAQPGDTANYHFPYDQLTPKQQLIRFEVLLPLFYNDGRTIECRKFVKSADEFVNLTGDQK